MQCNSDIHSLFVWTQKYSYVQKHNIANFHSNIIRNNNTAR